MTWLVASGVVIGVGTLSIASWAEHAHGEAIAHTMAVVTFSLFALLFSVATKDQQQTAFSLDTFSDPMFTKMTGISVLTLILATFLGPLQAILDTVPLSFTQWLLCLAVSASILVVSEVVKAVGRRSGQTEVSTTV